MVRWVAAAAVPVAVYGCAAAAGLDPVVTVCKPLPVAILAAGVAVRGRGLPARLLAVAMAIDAVADAVIEVAFLGGLALFLVGHLGRIASFTADRRELAPLRALPFAAVAIGASALLLPTAGDLAVPIALYALAICAMGWRAAARVDGGRLGWLGLAGAVLYATSDSLLAVNRFLSPLPAADLLVMSTYWGAQAAIASSIRE